MERRIDPDALLNYIELQIFPSDNRYEACVSANNRIEKVASGDLEQLLSHLPQVKDLSSKTTDSNFRILPPDDVKDAVWFTIATLKRFLNVVASPDFISIGNEISQLEETRKFQLSLFAKEAEVSMTSSFESKNELLRAVDSRLSGLKEQLADALKLATSARCSSKDVSNLENFAHHFGAEDIRDSLQKLIELSQFPSQKDSTTTSIFTSHPTQSNPPVKYGVSPAKAAQVERESSTDSENSFSSEEEDQPSVERSRTFARSVTPRRSASPMRRVQIGRTGPRRTAAISIKSLGYIPTRDKTATHKDTSSEEEDVQKSAKRNALRMSVQDKISLFEKKQKDQVVETEKPKTLSTAPVATKAVLRRWSSGMSESGTQCNEACTNTPKDAAPGGNAESCTEISETQSSETAENVKLCSPKKGTVDILDVEKETRELEMHPDSIEWNQQKEAELNQLFKTMMESKPVRRHSSTTINKKSNNNNNNNNVKEQRGGFYDNYKQKRDEKLQKEASGKKAERESQLKEMEKFLDSSKPDVSKKKAPVNKIKPQNSQKSPTQLPNSRKETSKTSVVKKATTTSKPSPLPAVRKSWPATPSPRPTGSSPAKTSSGTISTATLTRKPHATSSSVVRSSTKTEKPTKVEKPVKVEKPAKVEKPVKVEKTQLRSKTLKSTPVDTNKKTKTVKEKKQPTVTNGTKTAKPKPRTQIDTDVIATNNATTVSKPSFYNKVTKKSSVVPLETKPFLRKGTGIGPGVGPIVVKSKVVAEPEEPVNTVDLVQPENNQVVETTEIICESQSQIQEECEPLESYTEVDPDVQMDTPIKSEEPESFINNRFNVGGVDNKIGVDEESTISISPTAWVELEEHNQDEIIPCKESPMEITGAAANNEVPAGISSPRVRHSLFQMLLEETTSEADSCEWGNAQQHPVMVNQKDGPKGFKRLLKFARKTKADLNLTDGSSPSSIFRRG